MKTVQRSLRIPAEIAKAIEESAEANGREFSSLTNELLSEAIRLRRCPGILFADGPTERRARIAGTGIDVWEVVRTYQSLNRDFTRLRRAYHWLAEPQLRAALGYYAVYPEEIDRLILRNESWTRERLAEQYPSLVPRPR